MYVSGTQWLSEPFDFYPPPFNWDHRMLSKLAHNSEIVICRVKYMSSQHLSFTDKCTPIIS